MPDSNDIIASILNGMGQANQPDPTPGQGGLAPGESGPPAPSQADPRVLQSLMAGMGNAAPPTSAAIPQMGGMSNTPDPQAMSSLMSGMSPRPTPMMDENEPPTLSGRRPNILNFIQGMINPARGTPAGQQTPSRTDVFENFLGQFANSFATGLQAAGHGPGANLRGLGAAIQAPYAQDVQQYQMRQQAQAQQAAIQAEQARTAQTGAQTEETQVRTAGEKLQQRLLQQRITAMASSDPGAAIQQLGVLNPDEQAVLSAAQTESRMKGDMSPLLGAVTKIANNRAVTGRLGNATITADMAQSYNLPKSLIGHTVTISQLAQLQKGGAAPLGFVQGAAGPAIANKATGQSRSLGLGSPAANYVATTRLGLAVGEQANKIYQPAMDADFRLVTMRQNYDEALKGDQQAMVSLLTNHIGMTLGLQRGARITKDILHEAQNSAPWLQNVKARFGDDGYLQGVTLPQGTMKDMVKLADNIRVSAWRRADAQAPQVGLGVNDRPLPMEGLEDVKVGVQSPLNRVPPRSGPRPSNSGGGVTAEQLLKKYPPIK